MADIPTLKHDEPVGLDRANLESLFCQLGRAGAENVVCRAMEELAVRLIDLAPLHRKGQHTELARRARSLVGIAEQIGLVTLARVAGDVSRCAAIGDEAALAATLARLERIGDRSLTAVWDIQDLSI